MSEQWRLTSTAHALYNSGSDCISVRPSFIWRTTSYKTNRSLYVSTANYTRSISFLLVCVAGGIRNQAIFGAGSAIFFLLATHEVIREGEAASETLDSSPISMWLRRSRSRLCHQTKTLARDIPPAKHATFMQDSDSTQWNRALRWNIITQNSDTRTWELTNAKCKIHFLNSTARSVRLDCVLRYKNVSNFFHQINCGTCYYNSQRKNLYSFKELNTTYHATTLWFNWS